MAVKTLKGKGKCLFKKPCTHFQGLWTSSGHVVFAEAMGLLTSCFPVGDFDDVDVNQFVEESLKMSHFKHAHVMGLIGVCLDAGSAPYIVMPYMGNGSLLRYLKKERNNVVFLGDVDEDEVSTIVPPCPHGIYVAIVPTPHTHMQVQKVRKRLMVMCSQIASGMEYLASEKYIHRDLAARNCM